jgi:hypothetical protein
MKLIIPICILSVISTIYGTRQVMPTVAQISYILRQIPKDKNIPIEMRLKFAMNMYNKIVRYNTLIRHEILKK